MGCISLGPKNIEDPLSKSNKASLERIGRRADMITTRPDSVDEGECNGAIGDDGTTSPPL
jgi:hypothetical protein